MDTKIFETSRSYIGRTINLENTSMLENKIINLPNCKISIDRKDQIIILCVILLIMFNYHIRTLCAGNSAR